MPLKATIYRMYGGGGDLEAGRAGYSGVVIGQKKGLWNMGGMSITKSAKRLFISEEHDCVFPNKFEYFNNKIFKNFFNFENNKKTKKYEKE